MYDLALWVPYVVYPMFYCFILKHYLSVFCIYRSLGVDQLYSKFVVNWSFFALLLRSLARLKSNIQYGTLNFPPKHILKSQQGRVDGKVGRHKLQVKLRLGLLSRFWTKFAMAHWKILTLTWKKSTLVKSGLLNDATTTSSHASMM